MSAARAPGDEDERRADQLATLEHFLFGAGGGRACARREVHRLALAGGPGVVDDLCQDAWLRVQQRIRRAPLDERVEGSNPVEAYTAEVIRNRAVDLARLGSSARLRGLVDPTDPASDLAQHQDQEPGVEEQVVAEVDLAAFGVVLHDLRTALTVLQGTKRNQGWPTAAALATLVLGVHDGLELAPGTPAPDPRSRAKGSVARWAALHYAGRGDCFDQPDSPAVRQRRSTALDRVESLLGRALATSEHGSER